jgi:hypothetical protein
MAPNFPTTYDDQSSIFGDVDDKVILTLNGSHTYNDTTLTWNEVVSGLDTQTTLTFENKGSGPVTFTGVSDDMTIETTYTGWEKKISYEVEIDGTGTPNTFKWSDDGGLTYKAQGVNCSTSNITLNRGVEIKFGSATGHTLGDKWEWDSGYEIVLITAVATPVTTVTRGYDDSVAMAHADDAQATQDTVEDQWEKLRDALIATQKYKGLVGSGAPGGTPVVGEAYIRTDTQQVYACLTAGAWTVVFRIDHGAYGSLGADDHTHYHTAARKVTWHDGLAGDHLTIPTTHDHRGSANHGDPIQKFETGLDSGKGTPSAVGQVYYAYDVNKLYFSSNGTTWTEYSVLPAGALMLFTSSCPQGWTANATIDGKFWKGAPAGVWSSLVSGGATTHVHEMADVINHTHGNAAQTGVNTTTDGGHTHSFNQRSGAGGSTLPYFAGNIQSSINTEGGGNHSHTLQVPAHNTEDTGSETPDTDSGSSEPPYREMLLCRKD